MDDKPKTSELEFTQMEAHIWRMLYLKERDTFREHQEAWRANNQHHAAEIERLKKAVLEERKACEQACVDLKYDGDWSDCANAIRARGEKP